MTGPVEPARFFVAGIGFLPNHKVEKADRNRGDLAFVAAGSDFIQLTRRLASHTRNTMHLKRVYIKKAGGELASEACFAAWKGFLSKGVSLDFFEWDELTDRQIRLDRSTMVVGGTVAVHMALKQIGVPIPDPLGLPDDLSEFRGRRIWKTTLGEVRKNRDQWPIFVKPFAVTKAFPGRVINSDADLERIQHVEDDVVLLAGEPVVFRTEWRYYVHKGEIVGIGHYAGDWSLVPDAETVRRAVAQYHSAPVAYALDFGLVGNQTLLVEASDAFALGAYGIDAVRYATMLEDRWTQIVAE